MPSLVWTALSPPSTARCWVLAARVEDAEALANEAADRVSEALDQFRIAGETLSGKLERAEYEATEAKKAFDGASGEISTVKQRLEHQVNVSAFDEKRQVLGQKFR